MMVPRSYAYCSSSSSLSEAYQEKERLSKSAKCRGAPKKANKKDKTDVRPCKAPTVLTPTPPKPSAPVVIPTRTKHGTRKTSHRQEYASSGRTSPSGNAHDSTSTPPSMAALLAMTPIPEQRKSMGAGSRPKPIDRTSRRIPHSARPPRSLSSSSPQTWDFLLSPPEGFGSESSSLESDATLGPLPSIRSISTESMPSLAEDEDSVSSMSNPATPGFASHSKNERRKQSLSTSVGEDCVLDHPLLPPPKKEVSDEDESDTLSQQARPAPARYKTSFKSNLTASFRAIRLAAKSISDFTGPIPQRDDLLSRAVLSMDVPFTDERRPLPSADLPDPALRRYLNPITLSPAELHFHNSLDADQASYEASIQLQTCQPGERRSSNASSPPKFLSNEKQPDDSKLSKGSLDMEDAETSSSVPRQREPRENSDFLRVIVLEMNMRKRGKLTDASPGRAKLWLPARQMAKKEEKEEKAGKEKSLLEDRKVPVRWVSI